MLHPATNQSGAPQKGNAKVRNSPQFTSLQQTILHSAKYIFGQKNTLPAWHGAKVNNQSFTSDPNYLSSFTKRASAKTI
jgi:hypothetical protein